METGHQRGDDSTGVAQAADESGFWSAIRSARQSRREPPIPAKGPREEAPASRAQERHFHQIAGAPEINPFFNVVDAYRISGRLDVASLCKSIVAVTKRHDALRTMLVEAPHGVIQRIVPPQAEPLRIVDLSHLPAGVREDAVEHAVTAEAEAPFSFSEDVLARFTLFGAGNEEHILVIVVHHLVFDGWSSGILCREIASYYEHLSAGSPNELQPVRLQFADFAEWQREWLEQSGAEAMLDYWRGQLAGCPDGVTFPYDHPRPSTGLHAAQRHTFHLPRKLNDALSDVVQREGVTFAAVALLALQLLIHHETGSEDIAVGSSMANRNRIPTSGSIGFFTNTHLLRAQISGEATLRDLLKRTANILAEAVAHQDVPLAQIINVMKSEDAESLPGVTHRINFICLNQPSFPLGLQGLNVEAKEWLPSRPTILTDLILKVTQEQAGVRCDIEYSADLYKGETISALAERYELILRKIVEDVDTRACSVIG
ncbi:condensation domain-containing protein [Streptomyces niveiscabiei]|uniref:condensation domain-containing protein n=1 Tax=Streptomyces TaxID=1883 RepID=UPI000AA88B18|nr:MULTISPECIES: condensation domain-containing protein [Streptomyces]